MTHVLTMFGLERACLTPKRFGREKPFTFKVPGTEAYRLDRENPGADDYEYLQYGVRNPSERFILLGSRVEFPEEGAAPPFFKTVEASTDISEITERLWAEIGGELHCFRTKTITQGREPIIRYISPSLERISNKYACFNGHRESSFTDLRGAVIEASLSQSDSLWPSRSLDFLHQAMERPPLFLRGEESDIRTFLDTVHDSLVRDDARTAHCLDYLNHEFNQRKPLNRRDLVLATSPSKFGSILLKRCRAPFEVAHPGNPFEEATEASTPYPGGAHFDTVISDAQALSITDLTAVYSVGEDGVATCVSYTPEDRYGMWFNNASQDLRIVDDIVDYVLVTLIPYWPTKITVRKNYLEELLVTIDRHDNRPSEDFYFDLAYLSLGNNDLCLG